MGIKKEKTRFTVDQLKIASSELSELAAQLHAVAAKMDDNNVDSIEVTNHKTFVDGIDKCARFADAASRGWREAVMTPAGE